MLINSAKNDRVVSSGKFPMIRHIMLMGIMGIFPIVIQLRNVISLIALNILRMYQLRKFTIVMYLSGVLKMVMYQIILRVNMYQRNPINIILSLTRG